MAMHITVFCPHCQNRYQVEPALRGKRMRCLNTICRMVFEIGEGEAAPPLPRKPEERPALTKKPTLSGSVGEVVPVLSAEAVTEHEFGRKKTGDKVGETTADRAVSQSTTVPVSVPPPPPPPLDDLGIPGDDEDASSSVPGENHDGPLEIQPGSWEAPPVRTEGRMETRREAVASALSPPVPLLSPIGHMGPIGLNQRRRRIALIATMLVVLGVVLGGGIYLVSGKGAVNEAERFQKAQELYRNQEFDEAMEAFQKLLREFPSSSNRRQFDFLVELSAVREAAYAAGKAPEDRARALERVLEFLAIYKNDPLLKDYHGDVWHTLQKLTRELTTLAEREQNREYLQLARRSWTEAGKFTPPAGTRVDDAAKVVSADFTRVDSLLAAREARLELLDGLRELATRGSADAVREGRARAKNAGMEHDPEVLPLLAELVQAHRAQVVFTPAATGDTAAGPVQDNLPSFYIAPRVGKFTPRRTPARDLNGTPAHGPDVVLALAWGVLYALDAIRGDILWVRRVGVDTSVLPLRVPASTFGPELILVLSSDSKSVSAVAAASGTVIWQHTLSGVCLGRPVLVDRHLLVPTLTGQVEDIETTGGALQGSYALNQPLAVGGVHQPGTTLVYFPADSYSVYVLDVAERTCAAILYTGHAPGSLRGLPIVWNEGPPSEEAIHTGWLLINLASGGDSVELRSYALPIREPDQKPADLKIAVRGDTWTSSWHDGEKLALATNAGLLALYGIRQKGNRDPLLFPLLPDAYRLESEDRARRARAQVIHADAENYWVLSGGKLHRVQATFTAGSGPGMAARWPQPPKVGSPLHESQVRICADGLVTLFLVTQELDSPTCWVRALDAEHGQVLWQRQLGMVCKEQPVAASDLALSADARGVFLFHAPPVPLEKSWQPGGTLVDSAGKAATHWTCARAGGFVHLSWSPERLLQVRLLDGKSVGHKTHALPAVPLGTPALGSDFVLLPLANGLIYRVPLGDGAAGQGPEWRGVGVADSQPGHIAALGNDIFAISDGGRSLMRLRWGEARAPEKDGGAEMAQRITTAPAVLGSRLLVADASDTVTMLDGASLQTERRWHVGGKITAGPFVRAGGVGVIVGKNHLVWLDPGKDEFAWEYTFLAPVVGQPELVEGLLVVADLQGGIMGFDPATGDPAGPGYRLAANEAPTAAPLGFGMGQVFVPLMDGTVMLLPLAKLR